MLTSTFFVIGGVVIVVMVGALALMFIKSNQIQPDNKAPLFTHSQGEQLAAPFAEQIEDLVRAKINADPALKNLKVDLGTAPDGGLEIWVDKVKYANVEALRNETLKEVFREAIKEWESKK